MPSFPGLFDWKCRDNLELPLKSDDFHFQNDHIFCNWRYPAADTWLKEQLGFECVSMYQWRFFNRKRRSFDWEMLILGRPQVLALPAREEQVCISNDEFCIQMMNFAFGLMTFVSEMMIFVCKMMVFNTNGQGTAWTYHLRGINKPKSPSICPCFGSICGSILWHLFILRIRYLPRIEPPPGQHSEKMMNFGIQNDGPCT